MTKKETAQVLAAISSAYPNHDRFASEQAVEGMATIWAATFAEDDAKLVQLAVAKHIQTNNRGDPRDHACHTMPGHDRTRRGMDSSH